MVRQHLQVALCGADIDADGMGADREHVEASPVRLRDGQSDVDFARAVATGIAEALYSQAGLPEGREHHG
jgi:hypothetical protein